MPFVVTELKVWEHRILLLNNIYFSCIPRKYQFHWKYNIFAIITIFSSKINFLHKNISFFDYLSRQYEKFFYQKIFPEIFGLIFVRNPYNFDIYNLTFSDYGLLFHILIRVCCADFLYFGRTKNEIFEPTTRRKHETWIPRTRLQESTTTPRGVTPHPRNDDNIFISNFFKLWDTMKKMAICWYADTGLSCCLIIWNLFFWWASRDFCSISRLLFRAFLGGCLSCM